MAWNNKGIALEAQGNTTGAIAAYEDAGAAVQWTGFGPDPTSFFNQSFRKRDLSQDLSQERA